MKPFNAEKAALLAEQLNAELAKLGDEPKEILGAGSTLAVVKFSLKPLANNLRFGIYEYLEDGKPKTYEDFANQFK